MITDIRTSIAMKQMPGWVPIMLFVFGTPWAIWSFFALQGTKESQSVGFCIAAGWFVLFALGYLGLHGVTGAAWCSVPFFLTLIALVRFVVLPSWRFAAGIDQLDAVYVQTMFLVLIAFSALWIGSLMIRAKTTLRFLPQMRYTPKRIGFMSGALFVLGLGTSLVLFANGMYGHTSIPGVRESVIEYMRLFSFLADMLTAALLVSAIEVFGKPDPDPFMKKVLWISTISSIALGAISGSKGSILSPLLILSLVYGITRGRFPRTVLLLPLGIIIVYPIMGAYRANLQSGFRAQATTMEGLEAVFAKSIEDVAVAPLSRHEMFDEIVDEATGRLSLLSAAHDVIGMPDPSQLNGDEKVWLAPIYPLVPRFLWKEKPVLNKSQRASVALGHPATSAFAITPIGDLYAMYGTYGVSIGMFIYGVCLQLYMNWMKREALSERGLFIYLSMLLGLVDLEQGVVGLIAGVVQSMILVVVLSYVIYGRLAVQNRVAKYSRSTGAA